MIPGITTLHDSLLLGGSGNDGEAHSQYRSLRIPVAQSTCASFVKLRELFIANQILLKCQHDRKEFPEYVLVKVVTLQRSTISKCTKAFKGCL